MHRDYREIAVELAGNSFEYYPMELNGNIICSWLLKAEIEAYNAGILKDIGACNAVISKLDGHDPKLFRSRSEKAISVLKKEFKEAMKNV